MAATLNTVSAVAGVLSLTIQIAHITQSYVSHISSTSRTMSTYLQELIDLKRLLSDLQDSVLLRPQLEAILDDLPPSVSLATALEDCKRDLEPLFHSLRKQVGSNAASEIGMLAWPLKEDETKRIANALSRCRDKVQASLVVGGLHLQMETLQEVRGLRRKSEMIEKEESRLKILDWISNRGMLRKQNNILSAHHPNTGQWIFATAEFKQWFESDETRVLWCYGNPGVGKTQMTSLVADFLSQRHRIAYFYCDYQNYLQQSVVELGASLLRQLVEGESTIFPELENMYRRLGQGREKLKLDDITSLLCLFCRDSSPTFFLLDALDEYDMRNQRHQVVALLKILVNASAKLFVTSRPHPKDIQRAFEGCTKLEIMGNTNDIRTYVKHKIEASDELAELIDVNLKEEIVTRVTGRAAGMFLLAALQCAHISQLSRVAEIRRALDTLPTGLNEAYGRAMERVMQQSDERKALGVTVLSWLFYAKRSMQVKELLHALSVDPADVSLNAENLPSQNHIIDVCAGMAIIDHEGATARLVHPSVQTYFQETNHLWFPNAKSELARTCVTYLAFETFGSGPCSNQRDLERRCTEYPFISYAAHHWGTHVRESAQDVVEMFALNLLESPSNVMAATQVLDRHDFRSWGEGQMFPSANIPVQLASRFGVAGLVKELSRQGYSVNDADPEGRTALHWAARGGYEGVVTVLLEYEANPNTATEDGRTPLHWAAKHGHGAVLKELLKGGANAGLQTVDGRTALHWAASRGHEFVVRMLLLDAKVDVKTTAQNGWTALHWAAASGNRAVVSLSLEHGLDCEREPREQISLGGGDARGHEASVRLLLDSGIDPDARSIYGQTALHWAAASGNANIIQQLLDYAADPDVRDVYGSTPLHFAADNGAAGPIELLLSATTDVGAQTRSGKTALDFAASRGHRTAADLLFRKTCGPEGAAVS